MKFTLITCLAVSIVSCSPEGIDKNERQLASAAPSCDREKSIAQLEVLFKNYTAHPSYVTASIAQSIIECLGFTVYLGELKRKYDLIRTETASLKKTRSIASKDGDRASYKNWAAVHQAINLVGNVTEGTGDVFALGSLAHPGFAVPAVGFSMAGKYMKVLNVSTELKAASYFDKLVDKTDRQQIKEILKSSANRSEAIENFRLAFKNKSTGFDNLDKDLLDPHKFRALEAVVDNTIDYIGDLDLVVEQTGKSTAETKKSLEQTKEELDVLDKAHSSLKENLSKTIPKMANLQKKILDQQSSMSKLSVFLANIEMKRMTPQEKMDAIKIHGLVKFESNKEKDDTLKMLEDQKELDSLQEGVTSYDKNFRNVMSIFSNLGISSPILTHLAKTENAAMTLFQSYVQFQLGDPTAIISGLAGISSLFRKEAKDQFNEQLMNQLKEITELVRTTIDLQYKTMGMIADLSGQMLNQGIWHEKALNTIIELNRKTLISNHLKNTAFMKECDSFLTEMKMAIIIDGRTDPELMEQGLLSPLKENIPGRTSTNYLELMAQEMSEIPIVASSKIQSILDPKYQMSKDLEACRTKMNTVAQQLSDHVQRNEPIEPSFTQNVVNITKTQSSHFRDHMELESLRQESIAKVISFIVSMSDNKYHTPPYQVIYAGLNPSFTFSGLNKKISWLRKNSETAKKIVTSKEIFPLLKSSLGSSDLIDSQFLSLFIKSYMQIHSVSKFLNPDPLKVPRGRTSQENLMNLAKLTELAVFQKTLQSGDVLLAFYDAHFDAFYQSERDPPVEGSLIDDVIAYKEQSIKKLVQHLVLISPSLMKGLIKYRLIQAMKTESRFLYVLKYDLATKAGYRLMLDELYYKIGMQLINGPDNKLYSRFMSQIQTTQKTVPEPKQEGEKSDAEKFEEAQRDKISENLKLSQQLLEKFPFSNNIEIISPEEMMSDRTDMSEEIIELLSLRDTLLSEVYHYSGLISEHSIDYASIYRNLKDLVLQ
jgi:hypothetical protein